MFVVELFLNYLGMMSYRIDESTSLNSAANIVAGVITGILFIFLLIACTVRFRVFKRIRTKSGKKPFFGPKLSMGKLVLAVK